MSSLASPHKANLSTLRDWLKGSRRGEGDNFLRSSGRERTTWDKMHGKDFVVVSNASVAQDIWSTRISEHIIDGWHFFVGRWKVPPLDPHKVVSKAEQIQTPIDGSDILDYAGFKRFTDIVVSIFAAMLPALSILALYFVKNLIKRIGIMICLTFVFSGALAIFTDAKRIEIFSAAAA